MNKNLGIELFRIVCMLFIIAFHMSDHGVISINSSMPITGNWLTLAFARLGGAIGNCAFVIIGGYLLCTKEFDSRCVIKLWLQTLFYSIICGLIAFKIGIIDVSIKRVIMMLLPITYNEYWFISSYLILMLLVPFLNPLLQNISRNKYRGFIGIGILIFSLIPTITRYYWMDSNNLILFFIVLYAVGAYIRIYSIPGNTKYLLYAVLLMSFVGISMWSSAYINQTFNKNIDIFTLVWPTYRFPGLLTALCLFLGFKDLQLPYGKIITFFSTSVFSVYLLHIGRLQNWIFLSLLDDSYVYTQWFFPLWLIAVVLFVFIICVFIDKIRIYLVERPMDPLVKSLAGRLNTWLKSKEII